MTPGGRLVNRAGRALVGSMFVVGGASTFQTTGPRVAVAGDFLEPLVRRLPFNASAEQVIRFDAAAKVVGGLALVGRRTSRAAAVGLAASLVPTTLAAHHFWTHDDPTTRAAQRTQFFKNLSMLGGLLVVASGPGA